ncbi:hypothetical protein ACJRO7_009616 [Eucalyptus globulus]|uniref:NB-ARC domain-containing protein n=1 Tax=Eucalyptus globulus TaxID=34317 RepID=A0ABD3LEX6_EUCGL
MPKERDPFRKYVDDLKNRKWKCKFCGTEFAGSTPRIRAHLAGIPGYGIKACERVEDPVRAEALETFDGKGSRLDKSTRGTSGKETERTVFGASQSVLPSDDASNPTDTQNSNRHGCALQQPSCNWLTGTGTASSCPQDQVSLPPSDMPLDNLDNIQQSDPSNRGLDNENASSIQQLPMDSWASSCLDFSELPALGELPALALTDMDSCMPSSSQSPYNAPPSSHILPCGTDLIGPSSLPDMNEGVPMTSHPNTGNNFEENRALKRKLELLYSKEAIIRDELGFAVSLFLKEPRMEVANLLANVERLKRFCPEAAREDCLPLHQQVDTLMHEAEDLMRPDRGLFEVRETKVGKLLEEKMVGEAFRRNTSKIMEFLVGNQISRLGIYGMGGVGKTTIMVHIHNRLLEEANYGNVLWITMSQDINTQMLQDAIAEELELDKLPKKDVRKRAAMLCHCFEKRGNSTVILDDVWESFDLKEVGIPIESDGIKLVLTTRSFKVCNQMQCEKMIKIEPLSDIEAESLFFEEFGSKVALNLNSKAVVKSIVKECAGLPLAVITVARSMRGVTDEFEWTNCLEKLRESDMGQTDMEKVLKKLEFSYNLLGDHAVQQCFLSCAFYPEDELIDKFKLIELFIDQGLIGQSNTREKQYARGLTILNKLEDACLLENHEGKMKMHDLIRDMALHIMSATSIVKARKQLRTIPPEEHWTDALEKVSLMENYIEEFPLNMSPNCPKLSTFLLNTSLLHDLVIPDSFFKHLWRLKVLDLSGCRIRKLPDSILDLVNLTALLLKGCHKLHRIPHLGKLRFLRKLDISFCVRVKAVKGLEMLVNLRYLDMITTRIVRLPKGTLGALLNLQYLGVGQVNGEEITKLWALETLICYFDNVDDFNKFVRVVSKRENNLCYYRITMHQKDLGVAKPTGFGVLFRDCERSVNILGSIVSAKRESNGSGSGICILIPQDVRNLKAWCCNGATNLSDMGPLEKLEELQIRFWSNLRVLCGGQDEEVIDIHDSPTRTPTPLLLRSLEDLEISYCPKLKYLIGHEPKFSLPHLRRIRILYCEEMVGITVAATSPPPYPSLAFPSLKEIKVEGCDKMKRVVESEWLPHFPNLRRIEVQYCNDMEEIIGGLSSYMSVEEISPKWLLVEGRHELPLHLQNLQTIQVIGCEGMAELTSGAGQGQEGSITTPVNNTPSSSQSSISLPELNSLYLRSLPQLKSLCEVPITCNSMKNLVVIGCPELNKIPVELQLCDIEDLPYIEVEGKEKWKTLIWDHPDAQAYLQSHLVFKGSRCILKGWRNSCELSI